MPFVKMRFQVGRVVFYSRAFEALARDVEDLSEPLWDAGDVILRSVGEQFLTEGDHAGTPWAPLDPAYAIAKERKWGPNPILVASGEMRGQMLDKVTSMTVDAHRLVYEPDSDIAIYHQDGTRKMVPRPMVVLSFEDRRDIDRIFHDYIMGRRKRHLGLG